MVPMYRMVPSVQKLQAPRGLSPEQVQPRYSKFSMGACLECPQILVG